MKRRVWMGALALLASYPVFAGYQEKRWTFYGLRPLAMGNAFVSVADDFNALFYNPAGLARLKSWDGELINPFFSFSKNTFGFANEFMELQTSGKNSTSEVLEIFSQHRGENQHIAFGLVPHIVFPNFGFGVGLELGGNMAFHSDIDVEVDIGPKVIAPLGLALNFLDDRLSVGAAVKFVARGGVNRSFGIDSIEAFSSGSASDAAGTEQRKKPKPLLTDYIEGGMGVGSDLGLLFTPIKPMEPTIGVSITDVGGTPYSRKANIGGKAVGVPADRQSSVNIGASMKPLQSEKSYLLVACDMHSVNQPYSFSKKFNVGAEWGLSQIIRFGVGLHQGYFSSGIQVDVGLLNLRFLSYAEELGAVAGDVMDRRFEFQVKLLI
jgi:hypothetical protein